MNNTHIPTYKLKAISRVGVKRNWSWSQTCVFGIDMELRISLNFNSFGIEMELAKIKVFQMGKMHII